MYRNFGGHCFPISTCWICHWENVCLCMLFCLLVMNTVWFVCPEIELGAYWGLILGLPICLSVSVYKSSWRPIFLIWYAFSSGHAPLDTSNLLLTVLWSWPCDLHMGHLKSLFCLWPKRDHFAVVGLSVIFVSASCWFEFRNDPVNALW